MNDHTPEHATDGKPCWCNPRSEGGVIVHRSWAEILEQRDVLVKALKEAHAYLVDRMPAHALGVIEQALAKAEQ